VAVFISKLLYDTPCQKFARTGNIMHNGIFTDKANVEEFGYRSDSTSLSPIRLLTQSSSLHLMPVTGPKDFLQPYVFCYFVSYSPFVCFLWSTTLLCILSYQSSVTLKIL